MNREEQAALYDDHGRTGAARHGKELVVSICLSDADAADFIASVPGSHLRRSNRPGFMDVRLRGTAAGAFVDHVVDLLGDARRSRLGDVLDVLDEAAEVRAANHAAHPYVAAHPAFGRA